MEPESLSPYPQVPATCPYPEPTPSSPHDLLQLTEERNASVHKFTCVAALFSELCHPLDKCLTQGSPNFLKQWATPVIEDLFSGRTR